MLKNYLKIAYRKLIRKKAFAAINIIGLAVSLAAALLIFLYVQHELSYDTFHENADRIYRTIRAGINDEYNSSPTPLAPTMKQHIPGIEEAVRIWSQLEEYPIIRTEEKSFNEEHVYIADSGFFSLFTTEVLVGNPATALTQPRSLVLSEATAQKYFQAAEDAIGKSMYVTVFGEEHQYNVTAVAKDFPANSHFHFNALLSTDYSEEDYQLGRWLSDWPDTYFLLEEGVDAQRVQEQMVALTDTLLNPVYEMRFGKSYESFKANGDIHEYHLQPLRDIRLYSAHMYDNNPQGDIRTVYMFATIGLLLLFIAVFNYINLATAQSAQQAKSTGIRKVLGAVRSQLYGLFLTESVLICLITALVGLTICQIVMTTGFSLVHQFLPTEITLSSVVALLGLAGVIGLISGWVPAQLLSSFQPTQVLKGQLVRGTKGSRLRNGLVIAQFVVSSGLIISVILISQQLSYLQNKSLGFDKEHLLVVKNIDKLDEQKHTLKQMASTASYSANTSLAYNVLGQPYNGDAFTPVEFVERGQTEAVSIPRYSADRDYLATVGITLLMGNNFSPNLTKENQQILLNPEALRAFGWQDRPEEELIGKMIDVNGRRYELVGIIEDIHFRSLREKIGPMAIMSHIYNEYDNLFIRLKPGSTAEAISDLEAKWEQMAPELPFTYSFVDDDLDSLYASEQKMARLFQILTGLAIGVACLGLLGLAMFTAERRTKEIGVRKVLGASVRSIVALLSANTLKLVAVSLLLAIPLTWYLMQQWLENYEYQITIGWEVFALAGSSVLLIALITISFQTVRAALANPADALRNE
ncbi:MAG: ABC transporter permease [Bacteroidota bacterium]